MTLSEAYFIINLNGIWQYLNKDMAFFSNLFQISWLSLNVTSYLLLQSTTVKTEENSKDSSDTQSSVDEWNRDDLSSTQENTVDSTVNTEQKCEEENI